jgi:menaquinol-cytochrome c reductase cytochrome b/c subunit
VQKNPPGKNRKEKYEEEYNASKKGGESFFPDTIVRDAIIALIIVAVIFILAALSPAQTEPPADPTSTTYNPRPEWYFLFFFEFLKLFPGFLEPVAAIIIPLIVIILLVLIPFLDRRLERRYSRRKGMLATGIIVIMAFAALEVGGAVSAPSRPAGEESPLVQKGRQVYREVNCSYCHSINGVGGAIGPDLSSIGGQLDKEELTVYLQNPDAMVPETLHPKLLFTSDELDALVAYLLTLGAPVNYSAQAPELFAQHCLSCHELNGQGGHIGPDLTGIGDRRSLSFIESFTSNPSSVISGSTMPAFNKTLTREQIDDIAAYLASQKVGSPAPPPPPGMTSAPEVPHVIEGRGNCLACHESGVGLAPRLPSDHAGRTNDMCLTCHIVPEQSTTPEIIPGPAIPHELEGRQNCLNCHGTGASGAPLVPSDHFGRTDDTCRNCHAAGSEDESEGAED